MANTWRDKAPTRDITIHRGEDIDVGGQFRRDGAPWTPPDDTEVYFTAFRSAADSGTLTLPCVLDAHKFSVHIEETDCDTLKNGISFWFYVKTPDTTNGNPKVITIGKVKRVDPA